MSAKDHQKADIPALDLALALIRKESVTPATGGVFDILEDALTDLASLSLVLSYPNLTPTRLKTSMRGSEPKHQTFVLPAILMWYQPAR